MDSISIVSLNLHHGQGDYSPKHGLPLALFAYPKSKMKKHTLSIADIFLSLNPQPDILCLQEDNMTAPYWPNITPYIQERMSYPHAVYSKDKILPQNNVIVSRIPFKNTVTKMYNRRNLGLKSFFTSVNRGFVAAELENGEYIVNTHLDAFDIDIRHSQARELSEFIKGKKCILAGDLNTISHDEELLQILEGHGLKTSPSLTKENFTTHATSPVGMTGKKNMEPNCRRDYVFVPSHREIISSNLINTGLSDHLGVHVVLK